MSECDSLEGGVNRQREEAKGSAVSVKTSDIQARPSLLTQTS